VTHRGRDAHEEEHGHAKMKRKTLSTLSLTLEAGSRKAPRDLTERKSKNKNPQWSVSPGCTFMPRM
jgi:hypothetical protein